MDDKAQTAGNFFKTTHDFRVDVKNHNPKLTVKNVKETNENVATTSLSPKRDELDLSK